MSNEGGAKRIGGTQITTEEKTYKLSELRNLITARPTVATLRSWVSKGRMNRTTDKIIKLEVIKGPSGLASSVEAVTRFLTELNASL